MKNQFKLVAVATFIFVSMIAVVFSSCEKQDVNYGPTTFYKPCEDVFCLNGGICHDGNCDCPVGFEGTKCEIRSVDKFIGTYESFDACYMNAQQSYTATVQSDFTPITELTLKGLAPTFCSNDITAQIVLHKTNFNIPFQKTCGNYYVSGEGNINGDLLNVNLSFRDSLNHTSSNCNITMNRQ